MWWGVDSTVPINAASLANVRDWYRGGYPPQVWGRYLGGRFAVRADELAFARAHHIYVYVIVPDDNCSGCTGGDSCGNDMTAAQARGDALGSAREARELGLPHEVVLYKDIEEVSSCRHEPTAQYLLTWYRTMLGSGFRTGFYGNVHEQFYEFPRAYCAAAKISPAFRSDVLLAMNEDEPRLGAPRGSTGPHDAPAFEPKSPSCAPAAATVIWQYGESRDDDNWTDVDQVRPDAPGLLAPDGSVSG